MKALTSTLIVVVALLGFLGLYMSVKGDVTTTPVVVSVTK
jgi:hypothetical protein